MGLLIDFAGDNGLCRTGLNLLLTIFDACSSECWKLPSPRARAVQLKTLRQVLLETELPNQSKGDDLCRWEVNASTNKDFSTNHTWNKLGPIVAATSWFKAVWFKCHVIKIAFTFWIANLNRLPVRARLSAWGYSSTATCCTCNTQVETRDHLLLHCELGEQVWTLVLHRLGQPTCIF